MADLRILDDDLTEFVEKMFILRNYIENKDNPIILKTLDRCRDIIENSEILE